MLEKLHELDRREIFAKIVRLLQDEGTCFSRRSA